MKGIYALIIRINEDTCINVGAIGETHFKKGTYVYVGSAQINLERRVKRHLRREKRLFWHVDYLLNSGAAKIQKTLFMQGDRAAECKIAREIGERGEHVNGFGCSDCDCRGHLFRVSNYDFLLGQMQPLNMEP
jgi:Uri superfamily endonuclease